MRDFGLDFGRHLTLAIIELGSAFFLFASPQSARAQEISVSREQVTRLSSSAHGRTARALQLLAVLILLLHFASPVARAQSNERLTGERSDIVDRWSARVFALAELKARQAERALELVQQVRQEGQEARPGSHDPAVQLPPAYADVIFRETSFRAGDASHESLFLPTVYQEPQVGAGFELGGAYRKLDRASAYAPLIHAVLRAEGLPVELLAVPLIESGFDPMAESPKRAKGLWQLMPETARRYGLNPDGKFDERLDPRRSTAVAVRYLKELYALFGDWPLALAAYNAGEGRIQKALAASPKRDFWTLAALELIPEETRQYVPSVLAAARQLRRQSQSRNAVLTSVSQSEER